MRASRVARQSLAAAEPRPYSAARINLDEVMAHNGRQSNRLALAAGFGIGIVWIASALYVLVNAIRGSAIADRITEWPGAW
jgi:hypothetical protein